MKQPAKSLAVLVLLLYSWIINAEPAAPLPNKGDTGWMIVATVLVILMTIPGLAMFYAGMVRAKNILSVLMQVFMTFCMIAVLWAFYGYSIAFTEGNAFFGGFSKLFLSGITPDSVAATFSKGVVIPEFVCTPPLSPVVRR